ncbi:MAG: orotate phosphoribosyltransferase [Clostridiales bacterium]|nr:orotate phosphoribosyltransferase [Clostridiales bacterium]
MLTNKEIENIFLESEALLKGHFRLTSGRHSDQYMQCAKVLQYPHFTEILCKDLAERFQGEKIDVVIGPAMGGIIVAYEMARQLNARAIFAERVNEKLELRRGFSIEPGDNVLIVEDVITTGGSVIEVINLVRETGANIIGTALLVDRSAGKVNLGVRTESLLSMEVVSYEEGECPLCKEDIPVVKPGSRKV